MTGRGHRLMGAGVAVAVGAWLYGLGQPPEVAALGFALALPGATAPDWLELPIGNRRLLVHRGLTHWLLPWLGLLAYGLYLLLPNQPLAGAAVIGFACGGLAHWVGDVGTPMGVPVLDPLRRRSLGLWATRRREAIPVVGAWVLAGGAVYAAV